MLNLKKYSPYLAGLIFSSIFGFSFLFTKEALEIISPFHLLAFRFTAAFLSLNLLRIMGLIKINLQGKNIEKLLFLALFQPGFYFFCETTGMLYTSSSEAGMMMALTPVAVTILAAFILDEKPVPLQSFFVFLSVIGVFFIIINRGRPAAAGNYLGLLLLGGAVIAAGVYNIISRQLSLEFKPVEITYVMMGFGALIFNIMAIYRRNFILKDYFDLLLNKDILITVVYLGILSSVVSFFMMNYTLSKITAAEAAVFTNLTTVVSIIAGVIFRNEPFFKFQIVGAVLIIIGVWGTNYFGTPIVEKEKVPSPKV